MTPLTRVAIFLCNFKCTIYWTIFYPVADAKKKDKLNHPGRLAAKMGRRRRRNISRAVDVGPACQFMPSARLA
jgi:hypothetical protein